MADNSAVEWTDASARSIKGIGASRRHHADVEEHDPIKGML